MIRCTIAAAATLAILASGLALAKLPPLDDAAKAKAADAAAKAGWQGKVDAYQLCKAQDKIAAAYRKTAAAAGKPATTAMTAPAAVAAVAAASSAPANAAAAGAVAAAAKPAGGSAPAAAAATNSTSPSASQGGGTPIAGVGGTTASAPAWPGCADPGPYAAAPAEQKPLESSGAHSPASNATSPPSNRATSAELAPAKPGTATKP